MVRRTRSRFATDDLAYPIRVKFIVPERGMSSLPIQPHAWLKENLGHLAWAWGPARGIANQATAYYFRTLDDARRFMDAFPELTLADGVASPAYTSPEKAAGPERRAPSIGHSIGGGRR